MEYYYYLPTTRYRCVCIFFPSMRNNSSNILRLCVCVSLSVSLPQFDINSQEVEELSQQVQSSMEEIEQVKRKSNKELKQLKSAAERETQTLKRDISSLQSKVSYTDNQLRLGEKEMKEMEQDSLSTIYRLEISKKSKRIERLKQERNDMMKDMGQKRAQLGELQVALQKSQEEVMDAQGTLKVLESERQEDMNLIDKIKSQIMQEKDKFELQLTQFTNEIQNIKNESKEQIQETKRISKQKEMEVKTEIAGREANLLDETRKLKEGREELLRVKRQTRLEINQKRKESRKRQRVFKEEAVRDKKGLRTAVWDLNSQLDAAKYAYIISLKEAKMLRKALEGFETQMGDLQEVHDGEVADIEQKILAEEMFFAKSQFATRLRTVNLVEKLQRRFRRQEEKAKQLAEKRKAADKIELTLEFNTTTQTILRKREELLLGKANDLAAEKERAQSELAMAKADFDTRVINVNKKMDIAKQETRQQIETLRLAFDEEIAQLQAKGDEQKQAIIDSKNSVVAKIRAENQQEEDVLRTEMNQRINKASVQQSYLENEVKVKNGQMEDYESARKSIRALAKITLRLTKKKIMRR